MPDRLEKLKTIAFVLLHLIAGISLFLWMFALTPGGARNSLNAPIPATVFLISALFALYRRCKEIRHGRYMVTAIKVLCFSAFLLVSMWLAIRLGVHGLTVTYFGNPEFKGEPILVANERTISLDRVQEQFNTLPQYDFSMTWSGWLRVPESGHYRITTRSDNGSDLFIDGELLLSNWTAADHIMETGIDLTEGMHPLYISFMQGGGPYDMALYWTRPESGQREQIGGAWLYAGQPADWMVGAEIRWIPLLLKILAVLAIVWSVAALVRCRRSGTLTSSLRWVLPRFILLGFSIAIALILAEATVRLIQMNRDPHRDFAAQLLESQQSGIAETTGPSLNINGLVQPSANPDIVYELKPLVSGTFRNKPIRTNSHGMRDIEYSIAKPPHTYRIVGLGDSIMFGWGVDEPDCFLSVLERNLNQGSSMQTVTNKDDSAYDPSVSASDPSLSVSDPSVSQSPVHDSIRHAGSPRFEVLNMGVPGYNTALEAFVLRDKGLLFDPDLVIVNFVSNDFNLPNFMQKPLPFAGLRRSELFNIVDAGWRRLAGRRVDPLIGMDLKDRFGATREELENDPTIPEIYRDIAGVPGFERAMELMGIISRQKGIPIVVAAQALPAQLPVITRQCEQNGLLFFDINEAFTRYIAENRITDPEQFRLDQRDTHPNATAHGIIGTILHAWLQAKGYLS